MIKHQKALTVIALIASIIVAAVIGAVLNSSPEYYRLSEVGVETQGTVIAKELEQHQYIQVEYKVGNKLFKTGGHAEDIGKMFATVQLNEKVSVFYDPSNPEISTLGNPSNKLDTSYRGIVFFGLIPIIFFVSYAIKKRIKSA